MRAFSSYKENKYYLMHKKIKVLEMGMSSQCEDILSVYNIINEKHLPFAVEVQNSKVDRASLQKWWRERCIPSSRRAMRHAKYKALFSIYSAAPLLIQSLGLSLTDGYWICPKHKYLSWNKLNFFENSFSSDFGEMFMDDSHPFSKVKRSFSEIKGRDVYSEHNIIEGREIVRELDFMSPDITTDGWLKKRWIRNGKKSFLQKWGSPHEHQEPYNEVLATKIMQRLGINHVKYDLFYEDEDIACPIPYNLCENFIDINTELIPAEHVYNKFKKSKNVSDYEYMIDCYEKLGIENAREALDQMIVVDYLISNFDRHYGNFGIIRNSNNLKVLGVAPIFDSGATLWMDSSAIKDNIYDFHAGTFAEMHSEQIKLVSSFDWLNLDLLHGIIPEIDELFNCKKFENGEIRNFAINSFKIMLGKLNDIVAKS